MSGKAIWLVSSATALSKLMDYILTGVVQRASKPIDKSNMY